MQYVYGKDYRNELPVSVLAEDRLSFGIEGSQPQSERRLPFNQRIFRCGSGGMIMELDCCSRATGSDKGELKQAAAASAGGSFGSPGRAHQPRSSLFQGGRVDDAA